MIKKFFNNYKNILSIIIFFIIALWLVLYIKNHLDEFRAIYIVSFFDFYALIIFSLLYLIMQGLVLKISLDSFKINLKFHQWFGITLITLIGNFLLGFGGLGFRAFYLKKKHSFDYSHFVSTTAFVSLAIVLISALFGASALLLLFIGGKTLNWEAALIYTVVLLVCVIIFFIPIKPIKTKINIFKAFNNVVTSWQIVKKDRKLVKQIFILTFFEFLIFAGMLYFGYRTFGFKISFSDAFLPASLSLYSLYLSFVPAALGFYEAAIIYSSKIIGLTVAQGLSVVFLTRIVNMFWTFTLGAVFGYILFKRTTTERKE